MPFTQAREKLRATPVLALLGEAALDRLFAAGAWKRVKAKTRIVTRLGKGKSIYFIAAGVCRAQLSAEVGQPVALRRLRPGDHFGEIAGLTGAARTVDVIAETECILLECPQAVFAQLMRTEAAFAHAMAAALAAQVVALTERVFELVALNTRLRICAELLRLAREEGRAVEGGILIDNMPTHATIAATIKSQREVVTKALSALAAAKILRKAGRRLLIMDIGKLRGLVRRRLPAD